MKRILVCCLLLLNGAFLHAQDCNLRLQTARSYKAQGDYKSALKWYAKVYEDCGDYDGKVYSELKECENIIAEKNSVFLPKQTKLLCNSEGGAFNFELKKAPDRWSVSQCPDWMQVTKVLVEEKKVIFNVNTNPKAEIRRGKVILKSDKGKTQEFTITQKDGEERLDVQNNTISFGGGGGQQSVIVDANFNWGYGTSASWIHLKKQNGHLYITCSANDYTTQRYSTVTIFGKSVNQTISVTQFEGDTYFSVSGVDNDPIRFGSSGGNNNKLIINCNDEWYVDNECSWIKVVPMANALVVRCEANPYAEERYASFDIVTVSEGQKKTVLVEQGGAKPSLEKITLPYSKGERKITKVRPRFHTMERLTGNKGELQVKVYSNVKNWNYEIVSDDVDWITPVAFQKDSLLILQISDNNGYYTRSACVVVDAMGQKDTLQITQNTRGAQGFLDDYFDGSERTWKTTRFFVDAYTGESVGFRVGGLAKRWKFVEFSLLNFDVEYVYHGLYDNSPDHAFFIDWEPIVRGYLPLSRKNRRWALYMGLGISVNVVSLSVAPNAFFYYREPYVLFEVGAEFNWIKKDNISSRIFYKFDGCSSIGISFDFYKCSKKI